MLGGWCGLHLHLAGVQRDPKNEGDGAAHLPEPY